MIEIQDDIYVSDDEQTLVRGLALDSSQCIA